MCVLEVNCVAIETMQEVWVSTSKYLSTIHASGQLNKYFTILRSISNLTYRVVYAETVDLIPGKSNNSVDIIERSEALATWMLRLDVMLASVGVVKDKSTILLMEYQMAPNDKSRCISHQIISKYCLTYTCKVVNPTYKNHREMINGAFLQRDPQKSEWPMHHKSIEKYATSYSANKAHTVLFMEYWLAHHAFPEEVAIVDKVIKSVKKIDDIADALMQGIAWLCLPVKADTVKDARSAATIAKEAKKDTAAKAKKKIVAKVAVPRLKRRR